MNGLGMGLLGCESRYTSVNNLRRETEPRTKYILLLGMGLVGFESRYTSANNFRRETEPRTKYTQCIFGVFSPC